MRHVVSSLTLSAGLTLAGLLAPAAAQATHVQAVDLGVLARESEVIAAGRVVGLRSAWERGRIVTRVTLEVADGLKGARAGSTVEFSVLGGTVDGIGQWVPGEPRFQEREEVVVCLTPVKGKLAVLGMAQGLFRLQGPIRPEATLVPDTDGLRHLTLMDVNGQPVAPKIDRPLTLESLREAIRLEGK